MLVNVKGNALVIQACISQLARKTGKVFQKGATCPHAEVVDRPCCAFDRIQWLKATLLPQDMQPSPHVQMLINVSEGLLPNMAPSEHLEVIKTLEEQLKDLESCLQFHQSVFHQTAAADE